MKLNMTGGIYGIESGGATILCRPFRPCFNQLESSTGGLHPRQRLYRRFAAVPECNQSAERWSHADRLAFQ